MYFTIKQQVKGLSKEEYETLQELCHIAKNLYNQGVYNVRQYYFEQKEFLTYEQNYHLLKDSENYKLLNSNMAQQILKEVHGAFKSFFGLIKLAKQGRYEYRDIKLPGYLPKDGFTTLVIGFVRLKNNQLLLPYSNEYKKLRKKIIITIPPNVVGKNVKEIRIIPKAKAKFFELQYIYKVEQPQRKLTFNNCLVVDLGVTNLATCVAITGSNQDSKSFIIDGKRLKSYNQWFNKENARLQSIRDLQGFGSKQRSNRQYRLYRKRNNQVSDYINKSARYIINYCLDNDIGTVVIGYEPTLQRSSNIGKQNNQNFAMLPLGNLKEKLEYLCKFYGIRFIKQEESYTSKASFFDNDILPTYNKDNPETYEFSGKRIKRGLYQTSKGYLLNADVNGALNILRKSSVVDLTVLCSRGAVDTPVRIKIT